MSVKIGHAVMDENGQTDGPVVGDQTGKEVAFATWYAKNGKGIGWSHYAELKDAKLRDKLAAFIEAACSNDGIGYSQPRRTMLYDVLKGGTSVGIAHASVDCTSLIFIGLICACGIKTPIGYSGNMARLLSETGQFNIYTDAEHLETDKLAKRGGIYLRNGHALTVLGNGNGAVVPPVVSVPYVLVVGGSVYVRYAPQGKVGYVLVAHAGEHLPYLGADKATGWFKVETKNGTGYITNKARYVRLVE